MQETAKTAIKTRLTIAVKAVIALSTFISLNNSVALLFIKTAGFFSGALYLFGFSLSGVNVAGLVDTLIPVERGLCFFLSLLFGVLALGNFNLFIREVWKNEKTTL